MAAHKKRNGELLMCFSCKKDPPEHQHCVGDGPLSEWFYCHCSCQPTCTRPECNTKAGRVKRNWKPIACDKCHLIPCCCD